MGKKPRRRRHEFYYAVPAYQILTNKTNKECADLLGISERTYWDKVHGFADFTLPEAAKLATFLQRKTVNDIFLTKEVQ